MIKKGSIMLVGGSMQIIGWSEIIYSFYEKCGLTNSKIVIIPTAQKGSGVRLAKIYKDLGSSSVDIINLYTRDDCNDLNNLKKLENATGIFLTGGSLLSLPTILGGTPIAKKIRKVYQTEGVHIAGTSSGAAYLCEHMILFGESGEVPINGMSTTCAGLGLINRILIDTHFKERNRLGRLLSALITNPYLIGIGIDEDTAIQINSNNQLQVIGSGSVTIIDTSQLKNSSMSDYTVGESVSMTGIKLDILISGDRYDLLSRLPYISST